MLSKLLTTFKKQQIKIMLLGRLWFHNKQSKIAENHTVQRGTISVCAQRLRQKKNPVTLLYLLHHNEAQSMLAFRQIFMSQPAFSQSQQLTTSMLEEVGGLEQDTTRHSENISEGFVYFNIIHSEFGSGDCYEPTCHFPLCSMTHSSLLSFDSSE